MKVCVHTLGCKVNQYESDSIMFALENKGYEVTTELESADYYIINTCAVTNEAEKKSRQMVSKMLALNPEAKVLICGCASEKNAEQFRNNENVTYICGVTNKLAVVDFIEEDEKKTEIFEISTEYEDNYICKPSKTRAFVKIQDGCNHFCTYCIIPYLRGRSRSRDIISILNEIQTFPTEIREVVLTGIDISDYKIDGEPALWKLLLMLKDFNMRFRLGSLEQSLVDDDMIKALGYINNLCPHFHLSLQSGSTKILKKMNRHYTAKEYAKSIKKLRSVYVNPAITTDIIVGFPGETEKDFRTTCRFVKKVGFSDIHVFPYSPRQGTVAEKMPDQVDGTIKKQRAQKLSKIKEKLIYKHIEKSKKYKHSVLIEEKIGEYYVGYTENYIRCYIDTEEELELNTFATVKLTEHFKDGAIAELEEEELESVLVL